MKNILYILALSIIIFSCKNEKSDEKTVVEAEEIAINYQTFGDEITDENVLSKEEIVEKYKSLKPGDTVNLKFATNVKEVCQKKGCWMKVGMGDDEAMVRFKDYGFFMPKDIAGQEIIVNGKAYVEEMSVEDQRHYAEDGGKTAEEIAAITEPKRTLAFEADGVLIPEIEKQ
ncbi:hypothetical protein Aeqsu_0368 [Aequorivita sublithincola DSM 14238]|uniref:DUF4920 domain-containing protein n=1 Tax=Aequorivita sublithincola (strain DSM 14238 / LMG 21431 / ACAM 643 / 9-3) TaxID=746697 RepID=I3YSB4_AEQSU|nr:DUF4920 domain-containing protein [Aequorivita sublithincola]AFL79882.1 hypothetical protein Aeqsu_0368 [Aequorivita sublithincola DSM 14238]